MTDATLIPNQLLTIEIEALAPGERLQSRFEGVQDGLAWVAAPFRDGRPLLPPPGTEIKVWWPGEGGLYGFATRVMDSAAEPVAVLGLACPTEFEREQRRAFARVAVGLMSTVVKVEEGPGQWRPVEAMIANLSAGGALLWLEDDLPVGTGVHLDLDLSPVAADVEVSGVVVESRPHQSSVRLRRHETAVRFLRPTARSTRLLTSFVLRRQADLVKKGLTVR